MGTNECSQSASKSSWDSQDFGDVNMVLKMAHFHKSSRPQWVNWTHGDSMSITLTAKYLSFVQASTGYALIWWKTNISSNL